MADVRPEVGKPPAQGRSEFWSRREAKGVRRRALGAEARPPGESTAHGQEPEVQEQFTQGQDKGSVLLGEGVRAGDAAGVKAQQKRPSAGEPSLRGARLSPVRNNRLAPKLALPSPPCE